MISKPPMTDYTSFCNLPSSPHYQNISRLVNMQRLPQPQQHHRQKRLYEHQQQAMSLPSNQYTSSPGSGWSSRSSSSGLVSSESAYNNSLLMNNANFDLRNDRSSSLGEYSLNSIIDSMRSDRSSSFSGMNQWTGDGSWSTAAVQEQLNNNNNNNNGSSKNLMSRFDQAIHQPNQYQQQQQSKQPTGAVPPSQQQPKPATELKSDAFLKKPPTHWKPIAKVAPDVIDVSLAGLIDFRKNLQFDSWQSESPLMATSKKETGGLQNYPQMAREKNDYPNKRCKDCGFSQAPSPKNNNSSNRNVKPTLRRDFKIVIDEVFDDTIESEFDFLL